MLDMKPLPTTTEVEMWREGTFHIRNAVDESERCGTSGPLIYRYEVRLVCTRANLNEHGFICDSRLINEYWLAKYGTAEPKVAPSCENLACIGLTDLVAIMGRLGVNIRGAEVRVYGGSYSGFTARWGHLWPSMAHPEVTTPCPAAYCDLILPGDDVWMEEIKAVLAEQEAPVGV